MSIRRQFINNIGELLSWLETENFETKTEQIGRRTYYYVRYIPSEIEDWTTISPSIPQNGDYFYAIDLYNNGKMISGVVYAIAPENEDDEWIITIDPYLYLNAGESRIYTMHTIELENYYNGSVEELEYNRYTIKKIPSYNFSWYYDSQRYTPYQHVPNLLYDSGSSYSLGTPITTMIVAINQRKFLLLFQNPWLHFVNGLSYPNTKSVALRLT